MQSNLSPIFLTEEQVKAIHEDQIERYGGTPGVRDAALLSSAVASPAQSFGGAFLHPSLIEMSAAYLFHLCQNHPFFDGNKRTALASAIQFLRWNYIEVTADSSEIERLVRSVSVSEIGKPEITEFLQARHQLVPRDEV